MSLNDVSEMDAVTGKYRLKVYTALNWVVLALSVGLIAYISIDALRGVEFVRDRGFMTFQLWVCVAFIADFFVELYMSRNRWRYVLRRLLFLILSIPYLNIIGWTGVEVPGDVLYFLRFVPLARGALALSIVVGYVSVNRLTNIFASYTVVLIAIVYFGSLIFFEREHTVNPGVPDYMSALWWACSDVTTTGCTIFPLTPAGKVVSAVLAVMGMVMFPLFTVVITSAVRARIAVTDKKQSP